MTSHDAAGVGPLVPLPAEQRARTDENHVALEHVQQLRQFVEAGFAHPSADARQTRIGAVGRREAVGVGVDAHGAELVEGETPAAKADAFLAEDGRAGEVARHQNRDETSRPNQQQRGQRDDDRQIRACSGCMKCDSESVIGNP